MKKIYDECIKGNRPFHILTSISVLMILISFFLPPTGEVSSSSIAATGVLFAFAALWTVIKAIDRGIDAKMTYKDTSLEIINDEDND